MSGIKEVGILYLCPFIGESKEKANGVAWRNI